MFLKRNTWQVKIRHLESVEWNAGVEWWNGMVEWNNKKGSQNITRNSRVNRVGKNSRSGDQLIKDRRLGGRGPGWDHTHKYCEAILHCIKRYRLLILHISVS